MKHIILFLKRNHIPLNKKKEDVECSFQIEIKTNNRYLIVKSYTLFTVGDNQGSAWDGMGQKKSSHGINIFSAIPWDGTSFKNFSSHPMGYHQKNFLSHGMGRFTNRIFAQLSIPLIVSFILLLCIAPVPNRAVPRTADHCLLEIFFSFCETRSIRSVEVYKGKNSDSALVPRLL